jgi:glycosyltransferase involved in cell wall biosynthesis
MRVAVDVTPLLGARTGIGELVQGLVQALALRDDVELVPVAITWRGREQANATHRPIPARLVHELWQRTQLLPLTRWTGPVDVVHGTNYVVGPPDRKRTPRIVTVHDLASLHSPELVHPATRRFPDLVERAVHSGAFVQTDSDAIAHQVVEWLRCDPDRVRRVYPGIPQLGPATDEGLAAKLGTRPFILSIGTEEPRKGLTTILAAMPALLAEQPDLRWVHAGGAGWGTDALDAALSAAPPATQRSVHRLGRVSAGQRSWLLQASRVLVYPSIDEGFGFPPLEALSVGTPVVSSTAGSLPEVLGPKHAACAPGDAESLARHILEALQNADVASLRDQRRSVAARFSWTQMAADQCDWYQTAIDMARGAR